MDIVKTLDREQAIEVMRERGYGLVSESRSEINGITLNFAKSIDLGVALHSTVSLKRMDMTMEMVQLKLMCVLNTTRLDFFHKDFERFEKVLYLYSRSCLDLSPHILNLADKMESVKNALRTSKLEQEEEEKVSKPVKIVVTVKERKTDFWNLIRQVGKEKQYEKEMCLEFFNYWTEMNPNGKKMRFEMEKIFDVKRRLNTWLQNDKKWLKQYSSKADRKAEQQNANLKVTKEIIDKTNAF